MTFTNRERTSLNWYFLDFFSEIFFRVVEVRGGHAIVNFRCLCVAKYPSAYDGSRIRHLRVESHQNRWTKWRSCINLWHTDGHNEITRIPGFYQIGYGILKHLPKVVYYAYLISLYWKSMAKLWFLLLRGCVPLIQSPPLIPISEHATGVRLTEKRVQNISYNIFYRQMSVYKLEKY